VNLRTVLGLATRLWPAIAGVAGAVYFVSLRQYDQALAVLIGGLGLGQVLHQTAVKP